MTEPKKTLSLSAGALLTLAAVTGCGTQAEDAAKDAASGAQSAASNAASAATSAAGAASSAIADDDQDDDGSSGSAASTAASSASASASTATVADPAAGAAIDAVAKQHPNGVITSMDRDDDEDERWKVDVVVDGKAVEYTIAADGTLTEDDRDDDEDDIRHAEQATVTVGDAINTALGQSPDTMLVDEAGLGEDDGVLAWEIDFDDEDRNDLESVAVDATTGAVIATDD